MVLVILLLMNGWSVISCTPRTTDKPITFSTSIGGERTRFRPLRPDFLFRITTIPSLPLPFQRYSLHEEFRYGHVLGGRLNVREASPIAPPGLPFQLLFPKPRTPFTPNLSSDV